MSALATVVVGLIIAAVIVLLLVIGAARRKSEQQLMEHYLEFEERKAHYKAIEKELEAMPWRGADLNDGVDISCTITADDIARSRRRVKVYHPTRDTRAGTNGTVYYGQRFSAAIFDHIEFVDPPRGEYDQQWIRDHLMTRIAPAGKVRLSKEMVPHGKSD
ncbi:hypothetical protein FQ154_01710 [Paeniglutamicibacter gangotriensis]|uniref:Uncharacterized protein n=1 Tax=Paeniglutamicibacter gangotriensis TaxID=254787 RepID=A0A5B0EPX8_9MICC|nr:hypothetical protein [Paeniglutamicibacter gangotriensis]KAA0979901.1 hypothetical protein FQ154_01710 [Paeniglutamicibacter gangotriensis]